MMELSGVLRASSQARVPNVSQTEVWRVVCHLLEFQVFFR